MRVPKRRRLEGKTNYRLRINILRSEKPRIVFRKSNKYITGQFIKSENAQDYVITGTTSKELLFYGWPKEKIGSLKSLPACYLTGFLLGKKVLEKSKEDCVFDIGVLRNIKKSRIYAFLKGAKDAGVRINAKEKVFPDERRLRGDSIGLKEIFEKVKLNIENE